MSQKKTTELGLQHLLRVMLFSASETTFNDARDGIAEIIAISGPLGLICGCGEPGVIVSKIEEVDAWISKHHEHGDDEGNPAPASITIPEPLSDRWDENTEAQPECRPDFIRHDGWSLYHWNGLSNKWVLCRPDASKVGVNDSLTVDEPDKAKAWADLAIRILCGGVE